MEAAKRINLLGCPFDAVSFAEAVACIRYAVLKGTRLQVVPGSIDSVMKAMRDARFARELWQADLVIADGKPIVWAALLIANPIRGRVSGTDLVWSCASISEETGCTVALIGGDPSVTRRATLRMLGQYRHARLHAIPTPFPLGPEQNVNLVERIREVKAKIVLAALGAPRQERWIQAHLASCGAHVGIGVGSAFDIISGDKPRAPQWMQNCGLEWLHRLRLEPRRLGRRYLIEDSPFLYHIAVETIRRRLHKEGKCIQANLRH